MASYTFTLPGTSKSFTIKGPAGFTEAQARAIFDQQSSAGSLVGFKPGDILNAASQAAAGLPGAASQLAQTLSGVPGVGSTSLSSVASSATAAVSKVASVAKQTITTVTNTLSKVPVTNGINVADYAKEIPSLTSIQNISPTQLTAGLSQASKLVGQSSTQISNTLGVGKFGLNAQQLELSGVVKPGAATGLIAAGSSLTDVLKSPAVFTGKNGINSVDDLLASPAKQTAIQQQLMSTGVTAVKQLGLPIDKLNPSAAVGVALNAAKSIPTTMDWAKGLPLPPDVKTAFNQVAKDGAFSADFANQKINQAMKAEIVPIPASDTVNRETVNAAATRVVGNSKVPAVDYSSKPAQRTARELDAAMTLILENINTLIDNGIVVMSKSDRTRAETNSYNADIRNLELIIADLNTADGQLLEVVRESNALEPPLPAITARAEVLITKANKAIATIQSAIDQLRRFVANLAA